MTLPIVSRYEQRVEFKIASKWDHTFEKQVRPFYRGWLPARTDIAKIIASTRLPNVPYWSFGEQLPVVVDQKRNDDPEAVNYPLLNIAALLANGFEDANQLVTSRETFLARSRRLPRASSRIASKRPLVFVSHAAGAQRFSNALARQLNHRGYATWASADSLARNRESLLDKLKEASSLVLVVDDDFGPSQHDELEAFVSLSIRAPGADQIIPLIRSNDAMHKLPKIWWDLDVVDGRKGTIETTAKNIVKVLESNKTATSARARFVK